MGGASPGQNLSSGRAEYNGKAYPFNVPFCVNTRTSDSTSSYVLKACHFKQKVFLLTSAPCFPPTTHYHDKNIKTFCKLIMTLFQIPNNNRHFRWNQCFKLWDAEGLACTVYALRFTDPLRSFLWLLQETGAWGLCEALPEWLKVVCRLGLLKA